MSSKWSWYVGSLRYDDKCTHCVSPLRGRSGEVVEWCDKNRYHTDCLLEKLAAEYKEPAAVSAESLTWGKWGMPP